MCSKRYRQALSRLSPALAVAAMSLTLSGCLFDDIGSTDPVKNYESNLNTEVVHIGGATTSVAAYNDGSTDWSIYNIANRLEATPVQTSKGAVSELHLPDYIRDILVIPGSTSYALVALGRAGIGLVDITDPTHMTLLHTTAVNYYQGGISFTEGGGDILTGQEISGTNGYITSLATDGTNLFIGDKSFGIHKTALSNIVAPTASTETDGTLTIDSEVFTLQYAGENPWGGPLSLKVVGGNLYAAQGFLGMAIYSTTTLARLGYYNLYTDASVTEDWFVDQDVSTEVQTGYLDSNTGMPDFNQAAFEINQVWKNGVVAPTPWAEFDRYGKYYYNARGLDVATLNNGAGNRTLVFIAYGLGGLVAVDASNPASIQYVGYVPAVPAHGPDEPIGSQTESLFPHQGSGKLAESGAVSVTVDAANDRVFYSDHFAGLVVLDHAADPAQWHGASGAGNYDNDKLNPDTGTKTLGDHYPSDEFVTSFDMSASDPTDEESLPKWMFEAPSVLATGEISGHGGALILGPNANTAATGQVDVIQATGAGGLNYVDIADFGATLMADRFSLPAYFPGTDEIGAAADGSATQSIAIGHTEGVDANGDYMFVADGPHGMSVWKIANNGVPTDDVHLVANTLQDEYPVDPGTGTVYPTPHAYDIELNPQHLAAYVLSQSLGLRRVDITGVGDGTVGAPRLLTPPPSGFYEHNTEAGTIGGLHKQDHAYDVVFYGKYAVVADGANGLTVYDTTADASDGSGNHLVANIGTTSGKALLGRATGLKLVTRNNRIYAIVAAGPAGVGVVDMTSLLKTGNPSGYSIIKVFEPIKIEEGKLGKADGRAVDVVIQGDYAYISYDSFGIVAYKLSDLIAALPSGVDATAIWDKNGAYDYRPVAVSRFRIQNVPGYETEDGGALHIAKQYFAPFTIAVAADGSESLVLKKRLIIFAAYGTSGVLKIDWSDPANPVLLQRQDTVGEATDMALANGRTYVADGSGGIVIFK